MRGHGRDVDLRPEQHERFAADPPEPRLRSKSQCVDISPLANPNELSRCRPHIGAASTTNRDRACAWDRPLMVAEGTVLGVGAATLEPGRVTQHRRFDRTSSADSRGIGRS